MLAVVRQLISAFSCLLTLLVLVLVLAPPLVEVLPFLELLLLLEPPLVLVLVSEPPFFFLDVSPLTAAKAGDEKVLAVISTTAVTMAMIANVVVFIYTTTTLRYHIYELLNNVNQVKKADSGFYI